MRKKEDERKKGVRDWKLIYKVRRKAQKKERMERIKKKVRNKGGRKER